MMGSRNNENTGGGGQFQENSPPFAPLEATIKVCYLLAYENNSPFCLDFLFFF